MTYLLEILDVKWKDFFCLVNYLDLISYNFNVPSHHILNREEKIKELLTIELLETEVHYKAMIIYTSII